MYDLGGRRYEWLLKEKYADEKLIAKWKKPGYDFLCSVNAICKANSNFGTTSICRVPLKQRPQRCFCKTRRSRLSPKANEIQCLQCTNRQISLNCAKYTRLLEYSDFFMY